MCLFSFLPIAVHACNNKQVLHVTGTDGSSLDTSVTINSCYMSQGQTEVRWR